MAEIHIVREHGLGLAQARQVARRWAESAQRKLDMECSYLEGDEGDVLRFHRAGARGELKVTPARFQVDAKLGLLLGAFRERIEHEIVTRLDALSAQARSET